MMRAEEALLFRMDRGEMAREGSKIKTFEQVEAFYSTYDLKTRLRFKSRR